MKPLLMDGAYGTMFLNSCPDPAAPGAIDSYLYSNPSRLRALHDAYIEAGVDILKAYTFNANQVLFPVGWRDMVSQALDIARQSAAAAGRRVLIAGSVGPIDDKCRREAYRDLMDQLVSGGVDMILIETVYDLDSGLDALQASRDVIRGRQPVIFSTIPQLAGAQVGLYGGEMRGVNCGSSPGDYINLGNDIKFMAPSAPTASAAAWARECLDIVEEINPEIVGGCCGTTPSHISELRIMLDAHSATVV